MPYTLSQEEMDRLVAYLNGQDPDVLSTDIPRRYLRVAYDLQKKMQQEADSLMKQNGVLRQRLQRLQENKAKEFAEGRFAEHEAGFHDTDIALLAIHHLRKMNVRYNLDKVIHVTYLAYAIFLTSGVRLTAEHPQTYERGPWFWRVANRFKDSLYAEPDPSEIADISRRDPAAAAIVRNVARKYHDVDTREMLLRSEPFLRNDREHNDGKWNKTIPDGEIWAWQKGRKNP